MPEAGRIVQIIPATGWLAVAVGVDAASSRPGDDWEPTEEDVETEPVACWALVDVLGETEVRGLVVNDDEAALVDAGAYMCDTFLGFAEVGRFAAADWVWQVEMYLRHARKQPA